MSDFDALMASDFQAFAFRAHLSFGENLERAPYLNFLTFRLQEFASGRGPQRLIVSLPPRHLKTFTCSKALPAWILGHHPKAKIMIVCYGKSLAREIAYHTRAIMLEDWYRKAFPTRLAKNRRGVLDFATTAGGELFAASIDGAITGRGADFIIVDDPAQIDDYANNEKLELIVAKFNSKIRTRLNHPRRGRILVVAHRISENDLPGHLIAQGGFDEIKLPFVATRRRKFKFGDGRVWVREKGDFLLPYFTKRDEEKLRKTTVKPSFEMLYQQNPKASSRLRIHAEYLKHGNAAPDAPIVLSIDPGQKGGEANSYSCVQAWAYGEDVHTLVDVWRGQVDYRRLRDAVRQMIRRHLPSVVLIEGNNLGGALATDIRSQSGMVVESIMPRQSKVERLRKHIALFRAGGIVLQSGAWNEAYIAEMIAFPDGEFDDQVDATSQFLDWAVTHPAPPKRKRAIGAFPGGWGGGNAGGGSGPSGATLPGIAHREPGLSAFQRELFRSVYLGGLKFYPG